MDFHKGGRVELVRTNDPHTLLRPGDRGTVTRVDEPLRTVYVAWDSGSGLAMVLEAGDLIRPVPGTWELVTLGEVKAGDRLLPDAAAVDAMLDGAGDRVDWAAAEANAVTVDTYAKVRTAVVVNGVKGFSLQRTLRWRE